jgi:hypothetical protein
MDMDAMDDMDDMEDGDDDGELDEEDPGLIDPNQQQQIMNMNA